MNRTQTITVRCRNRNCGRFYPEGGVGTTDGRCNFCGHRVLPVGTGAFEEVGTVDCPVGRWPDWADGFDCQHQE